MFWSVPVVVGVVGGVVVATFGFFWNFTIEAILYLGVVASLLPMKTPYYLPVKREVRSYGLGGIFSDLKDGFKYLWNKQRVLSQLIILSSVPNIKDRLKNKLLDTIDGYVPEPIDLPNICKFYNRCPESFSKCENTNPEMFNLNFNTSVRCLLYM